MGWAMHAIAALQLGETVTIKPRGQSMRPRVADGQEVTVSPIDESGVRVGDVVLCRVKGRELLHLVKAVDGSRVQIANNAGHVNGWIGMNSIYGKAHI